MYKISIYREYYHKNNHKNNTYTYQCLLDDREIIFDDLEKATDFFNDYELTLDSQFSSLYADYIVLYEIDTNNNVINEITSSSCDLSDFNIIGY